MKKYGKPPMDLEPTLALLDDLKASATQLGARSLNATQALRDVEPGAFLNGDIHMTPKGHQALADALARVLDEETPLRKPKTGFTADGKLIPHYREWEQKREVVVKGSTAAGCSTKVLSGWYQMICAAPRWKGRIPTDLVVVKGDIQMR
ncbi:MAG: hypothetical protein GY822_17945 [Deltaproteobacteria bacterium]|nr:hypothetical protein [Deltaproteobacteria bacterium]